jgi:glycosyltransferase involved in cell wall biosynthesis
MISVCVTAYNAAETLPRALDSLLAQTYKDFDALIANDGSTDATRSVIERYAMKDKRVRLIDGAFNEGVAAARRKLIDGADREYVFWLDADDVITPDTLENMVAAARESSVDIIGFGELNMTEFAVYREYCDYTNFNAAMSHILNRNGVTLRPMARMPLLKKCQMTTKNFAEDFQLALQGLIYAKRAATLRRFIYRYTYNPMSICGNLNNARRNLRELITALEFAESFLIERGYPEFAKIAKRQIEITKIKRGFIAPRLEISVKPR